MNIDLEIATLIGPVYKFDALHVYFDRSRWLNIASLQNHVKSISFAHKLRPK